MDFLCSRIIAQVVGILFEGFGSYTEFEICLEVGGGFESIPGCHDLIVWIGFTDFSLGIDFVNGKVAGPMEVQIGIEHLGIEAVDFGGVFLWDMAVAHDFADDSAVFAFGERVIVGLART